jgi:FkbM family methyltransferase
MVPPLFEYCGDRVAERDLIIDLGMYEGQDSRFYLSKGFRVVALEANPELCRRNTEAFAREIADGRLTIVQKALWHEAGKQIPFYVYSAWSSVFSEIAGRDNSPTTEIQVATTTVAEMLREFGVPYYLKCDIEGADAIVCDQVAAEPQKPDFVSFEDESGALAKRLAEAGYDRFQFINQGRLHKSRPPNPAREGRFVDAHFDGATSGLFGRELNPRHWSDLATYQRRVQFWTAMREKRVNPILEYACRRIGKAFRIDWLVKSGWADVHATRADVLARTAGPDLR